MIIFNWPDKCPKCQTPNPHLTTRTERSGVIEVSSKAPEAAPDGTARCSCSDPACGHTWKIGLAQVDPVLLVKGDKVMAMAAPELTPQVARQYLAVGSGWIGYSLRKVLAASARRVSRVLDLMEDPNLCQDETGAADGAAK